MNNIMQWLKDELESHGTPKGLEMSWEELDSIFEHIEKQLRIKLK